jgi:hypothetical protein
MRAILIALLLLPALARADQDRKTEEAMARFDRGVVLYQGNNFTAALAEFEAAYRLTPRYPMLFNIGVTQKRLFRYGEAVRSLRRYLDEGGANVPPERRAQVEEELALIRAVVAEVTVRVDGAPADIDVDSRAVGKTPLDGPLLLAAGPHTVGARRSGDEPAEKKIQVVSGERLEVVLELHPLAVVPTTARLTIATQPPGAELTIDGRFAGREPWSGTLGPGGHQVRAELKGYVNTHSEVVLSAGQERTLTLELQLVPPPQKRVPVYKRWWLWTIVGVVAAGAVAAGVGGYFATRPQPDIVY